jgi:hypothetical protein
MIFLKQKPERGKNCKHILGRSMFLSFIIIFVLAACAKKNQSTNVPTPTQNEAISPVQTPSSSPTSSSSPSQVLTGELLTPTNDRVAIEEGNLSAYVSKIDDAVSGGFVVTVENKEGESVKILLNENVSHVEKIEFLPDNQLEVIGRVDPEFLACEIFDIDAGDLIGIYYGYGFTHLENGGMIYVLPGPHFSGNDRGSDKIVDQSGNILYESEPGVRIMKTQSLGDDALTLVDGCVYFEERSEGGPTVERVVNITIDEVLPSPSPSPLPLPIPVLSDDELQTMSVNTTYSPNGKYFIESYGVNPDKIGRASCRERV